MVKMVMLLAGMACVSPAFAQMAPEMPSMPGSDAAKPPSTGEMDSKVDKERVVETPPASQPESDAFVTKFKPRGMRVLPKLLTEEAAIAAAKVTAAATAKRAKLGEAGSAQYITITAEYAIRKNTLLSAAHAAMPKRIEWCEATLRVLSPRHADQPLPKDWVAILLEAARLRPEQLQPRLNASDRESAFTALVEYTKADAEVARFQVNELRKLLAECDPWTVSDRMAAEDRKANDAVKLVLTPDDYFKLLEARGVIKTIDYEVVGTVFFSNALDNLEMDDSTRAKVSGVLADVELINEIKYERIARILGDNRDKDLARALKDAQKARESHLKAEKAKQAAEKKAADKKAADKKAADKRAAEKKAAEKKVTEAKVGEKKVPAANKS